MDLYPSGVPTSKEAITALDEVSASHKYLRGIYAYNPGTADAFLQILEGSTRIASFLVKAGADNYIVFPEAIPVGNLKVRATTTYTGTTAVSTAIQAQLYITNN